MTSLLTFLSLCWLSSVTDECLLQLPTTSRSKNNQVTNTARGSNTLSQDRGEARNVKEACRSRFGAYTSDEVLLIVSRMPIPLYVGEKTAELSVNDGGRVTCSFDPIEFCSWYSMSNISSGRFEKVRFRRPLDVEKFHCTTGRMFEPDGHFLLLAGIDSEILSNDHLTSAIETEIPCQLGPARMLFDYWAIGAGESSILQICISSSNSATLECQEPLKGDNALIVNIPERLGPFIVRIQISAISHDDLILIDNIFYEGQLCELVDEYENADDTTELSAVATTTIDNEDTSCGVIECNFNYGDACFYDTAGPGSTGLWQIVAGRQGNRLTGIQRRNPNDPLGSYAFVGRTSDLSYSPISEDLFIMESMEFTLSESTTLLFDLYLRSVGPQLKDLNLCDYDSPQVNSHSYWFLNEKVHLTRGVHKLHFIATGIGENLYLAIDNIRLNPDENTGNMNICELVRN